MNDSLKSLLENINRKRDLKMKGGSCTIENGICFFLDKNDKLIAIFSEESMKSFIKPQ